MQLILLIAGLILLIVGGSWFTGAATIGIICLVVFAIITVIQVAVVTAAASKTKSGFDKFDRRL